MERARKFYEETLGLEVMRDDPMGPMYKCGEGTALMVYESAGAGTSEATYAAFKVDDLDAEMEDLRGKGVEFEDYDMPGLKTVDGIAEDGGMRTAWFKDPDGNILAIGEMS
jgi:catechol 2,3-dioxygenase-like lactoylglutathione lyase family enzyme